MDTFFLKILNMSISALWLILAVILLRLVLKKAPKWINVLLWALVAVRLLCPISFESALSLVPNAEPIPQEIFVAEPPQNHESPVFHPIENPNLPDTPSVSVDGSIEQVQWKFVFATFGWAFGVVAMLVYASISYLRVKGKVKASLHMWDNIWICDDIQTPFILGVFMPKIYIPSGVDESQLPHIIAHENAHLKRLDHWWKPMGFAVLAVHWFNPLVWVAYILLCRDIELACDEKVIRKMNQSESIAYSETLLSCSANRRMVMVCPIAFGEVGVKERVKRVLHYRKPAFWLIVSAVIICIVVAICFLTNPSKDEEDTLEPFDHVNIEETVEPTESTPSTAEAEGSTEDPTESGTQETEAEGSTEDPTESGSQETEYLIGPSGVKLQTSDKLIFAAAKAGYLELRFDNARAVNHRSDVQEEYLIPSQCSRYFSYDASQYSAEDFPGARNVSIFQDKTLYVWYDYPDWTEEDGYFGDGVYLILVDVTATSVGAEMHTNSDDHPGGIFDDPYIFFVAGYPALTDISGTTWMQKDYQLRYTDIAYFSLMNQRSEHPLAVRLAPGESITYTIGYLVTDHELGGDFSLPHLCLSNSVGLLSMEFYKLDIDWSGTR